MVKTGSIHEFKNGWLMGNFVPSLVKNEAFEVAIHRHQAKTGGGDHIHKIATEYNIVVDGEVTLDHTISIRQNGYWITEPGQSFDVYFKEYTTLLVIKLPSVTDDKYPRGETPSELARFKDQMQKYNGPVSPRAKESEHSEHEN